jgi:hypothetical protein
MSQGNSLYSYLKQTKISFFSPTRTGRRNKSSLGELIPIGGGRRLGKGMGG